MPFSIITVITIIFWVSFFVVFLTFGFYGIFLLFFARKNKSRTIMLTKESMPNISIVLPTFNEGNFIQKKIENLLDTNYDLEKIEIIIVDDSNDKSSIDIISDNVNKYSNIYLHRSDERRGYNQALQDGFQVASGEIVIITDCGSLYDPATIPELVQAFNDPEIGGVTGAANIINQDEGVGKSESFYRKIYNFMRKSESNADSTFHFHGEVSSIRKELLKYIPSFPTNLDIAIAFHIRKKGYKVIFNPKAKFYEFAPKRFNERYKQKSIRAIGLIKVILGNKGMFSPKYGLFGLIIYPAHFSMMIICPPLIATGGISFIFLLLGAVPDIGLFALLPIIVPLVFFYIIKKELLINFIQLEFVLLLAIWKAFINKDPIIFIDKIDSTRQQKIA